MNRRSFITRFGTGIVGALALAHVPAAVIKAVGLTEPARRYACEHLTEVYRAWCKCNPGKRPQRMEAGSDMFDAYEGELPMLIRWTHTETASRGVRNLMFRALPLESVGAGWHVRVIG